VKTWQPPLILLALILPGAIGFAVGGPGLGVSLAGLSLVGLVAVALKMTPENLIGRAPHPESERRLLIVATFPVEDAATIQRVADEVGLGGIEPEDEIRVLVPASNTFLNRWATDLKAARERAQRDLVISIASLTLAGLSAEAELGDEDVIQAVEDQLSDFDATEVFLLSPPDDRYRSIADSLRNRLRPPLRHVEMKRI
jgi:hypothetical protein